MPWCWFLHSCPSWARIPQFAKPIDRSATLPSSLMRSGVQGGDQIQLISTSWMPSKPTSTELVAPSIMSVSGHEAEVDHVDPQLRVLDLHHRVQHLCLGGHGGTSFHASSGSFCAFAAVAA